jgi:putative endonuclease
MSISKGRFFENKVKEYLKSKNFTIISSNFYSPYGEIDLISEKNGKIYFIEVKYLSKINIINPVKKIDIAKIRRIFLSISYLKKFCRIANYQVDSYSVYFKQGKLTFECYPDLRLH